MAVRTEEQLTWERRRRPRAGGSAIAAGLFTLGGSLYPIGYAVDVPSEPVLRSLAIAQQGRESSIDVDKALYYHDHASDLLITGVLAALGALALILVLLTLARATQARTPAPAAPAQGRSRLDLAGPARVLAIAGPVLMALGQLLAPIARTIDLSDFADSARRSASAAEDALEGGAYNAGVTIGFLGTVLLGFAVIVIARNAMRAGLLTRFMGVLGIIVGVLYVIPIGSQIPIVPAFWLIAIGVMLLGVGNVRASGQAEPWPSSQQLREERMRQQEERREARQQQPADGDGEPAAHPEPATRLGQPSASTSAAKRKKRKRR